MHTHGRKYARGLIPGGPRDNLPSKAKQNSLSPPSEGKDLALKRNLFDR